MKYFRGTEASSPMSDWGHAMFVDNFEDSYCGSGHDWIFYGDKATPIADLKDKISAAWLQYREDEFYGEFSEEDNNYFLTLTVDEVVESFNPDDIVESADGYDSALVAWLYDKVLEPNDIYAVTTSNGAVVFDETLIEIYNG